MEQRDLGGFLEALREEKPELPADFLGKHEAAEVASGKRFDLWAEIGRVIKELEEGPKE